METKIANEIKTKIFELLNKYYEEYVKSPNKELKTKYNDIMSIYMAINDSNYKGIIRYFESNNKIPKEVQEIYDKVTKKPTSKDKKDKDAMLFVDTVKQELYAVVVEQYNKAKSNKSQRKQYKYLKEIYEEIAFKNKPSDIIAVFRKLKSEINTKQPHEKKAILQSLEVFTKVSRDMGLLPKKPEVLDTSVKEENITMEDLVKDVKVNNNDAEINRLININKKVVALQEELSKIDLASEEAKNIRIEISKLCDERDKIIEKYLGTSGVVLSKELESLEIAHSKALGGKKDKPYYLSSDEYAHELRETIEMLNDLKFFGIDSKYVIGEDEKARQANYEELLLQTNKRYNNLVTSLYKEKNPLISENKQTPDASVRSDNLLAYLELYNLRKGYSDFKKKRESLRIGNEIITASVFDDKVRMIKDIVNQFVTKSSSKVRENGNKVEIKDTSRNKDTIKQEMAEKMNEIFGKIMVAKHSMSQNQGVGYAR